VIPIDTIILDNPYSQDDAMFLMGEGFTEGAAREVVCEACRSGQLKASKWRNRWWFSGRAFVEWVTRWFGAETETQDGRGEEGQGPLARVLPLGDDGPRRLGARSPTRRGREANE
jgi:hypothetical protein